MNVARWGREGGRGTCAPCGKGRAGLFRKQAQASRERWFQEKWWRRGWAAIGAPQTKAEGGGALMGNEQRHGGGSYGRSAKLREEAQASWTEGGS